MRNACLDFIDLGAAIFRRPAFDDVGDEKVSAVDLSSGQNMIEKAPGGPDKWAAAFILFAPRRLPDNHDFRREFAFSGYSICPGPIQWTFPASANLLRHCIELFLSYGLGHCNLTPSIFIAYKP